MDALLIILTASFIAIPNGLLGNFLILRKMSMIGDAISHAVLPGIVIGFLFSGSIHSLPILIGAASFGLLTTLIIETFYQKGKLQKDASIGVAFTTMFALGVILVSLFAENVDIDTECVLNGEIGYVALETPLFYIGDLGIPITTMEVFFLSIIVIAFVIIGFKGLLITSFDEAFAKSIGVSTNFWNYLLMSLVSIVTVLSFESVGAILVVALMIAPASSAYLVTKKLKVMIVLSILFGITGSVFGYYLANYFNTSISAGIVVVLGGIFSICFIFATQRKPKISYEGSEYQK